jgi:hypothetical protein
MMLQSLLRQAKEQIAPWIKDGQPNERVFWELARFPVEWMGVGVPQKAMPFDADEFFHRLRSQNLGMQPQGHGGDLKSAICDQRADGTPVSRAPFAR